MTSMRLYSNVYNYTIYLNYYEEYLEDKCAVEILVYMDTLSIQ